jgi:hypothetical protein
MSFFSWLRNRTSNRTTPARAQHRPAAPRFRPQLEALEGRDVPSTLTVINNLDSGPGSLRAEITAAQAGDTIAFGSTLTGQTITLTSGELLLNQGLTIQGPGAAQLAVSGGNSSRVFEVAAGVQAIVAGLTISGGDSDATSLFRSTSDGYGGAILNWGTLTLNNSTVSGSAGANGGGIYSAGALTLSNDTISGNTASGIPAGTTGGGIYSAGALTLSNDTISGNTAYRAGGIYSSGSATLTGCTLTSNTATGGWPTYFLWDVSMAWSYGTGGGIYNDGTMTVSSCTLSGNTVADGGAGGGGIYNARTLTVSASTLSGNSAREDGGGIYNDYGATLTLKQGTTVTQNSALEGADLYNLGGVYISKKH